MTMYYIYNQYIYTITKALNIYIYTPRSMPGILTTKKINLQGILDCPWQIMPSFPLERGRENHLNQG